MTRLCVFARAPVLGEVKSRLARTFGEAAALAAYQELVTVALDHLARVPGIETELWIAGALDHPGVVEWSRQWGLPISRQQGADLGARMRYAIDACLADGTPGMVVGTDCPTITAGYVQQAAADLDDHDLVLGPAQDGGYGLIGLRLPAPTLFADMPWGSDRVLAETLARAREAGLDYRLLETVWDVDEPEDWVRFNSNRQTIVKPG